MAWRLAVDVAVISDLQDHLGFCIWSDVTCGSDQPTASLSVERWRFICGRTSARLPRIRKTSMTNDNDLEQAVLSELAWEPFVTAVQIGVTPKGAW